jgi:DNA-binding CsgD family transcriptional regulator
MVAEKDSLVVRTCLVPRIGSGIQLVGRSAELTALRSALTAAANGQAGAVLLSGDAGVGKSRLLAELVEVAHDMGATVFTGRCLDVDEAGLPYLPFVEALGQLTEAQGEVARNRPVLSWLVPGLGAAPVQGEEAMEQLRLFDSVHGLLSDLASDRCVLLALEDLHWADASTRDLVLFLVSRLYTQRILLVCTYRTDDLHRRHPLRSLLGELSRLSTVEQIALAPFDLEDTVEFVSALSDGTLPAATIRKIADRSEGNAFFCEELTAVYGDSSGVPSGLAELLLARVERLGVLARRVVRAASVASTTVTHESLQTVSALPADELEEALREAVQLNVLVTVDGGYTFRHALLREAVYGDLLPGERVRLHAGYAQVVDSQALLAYHSFRSHDLPRALSASVRAAHEAAHMRAPGEKLHHVSQALELWGVVPDPEESSGADEICLLRMAATAAAAIGETERAVKFARTAVMKADELGDPETAAEARLRLVLVSLPWEYRSVDVKSIVEQAWDLVRDRPPSVTRAKTLALLARSWNWRTELEIDELRAFADEAIENAKQAGAPAVEVDALVTLAVFAGFSSDFGEAIDLGQLAADRAASIGAYEVELRARKNTAICMVLARRLPEALKLMETICRRAAEVGLPWGTAGVDARMELVHFRYLLGDWSGALARAVTTDAPGMVAARVAAPSLAVLAAQGEFARLDAVAADLSRWTEDALAHAVAGVGIAEGELWRSRQRAAVDQVGLAFDQLEALVRPMVVDAVMVATVGITALADLADEARLRRDSATERDLITEGERLLDRIWSQLPMTRMGKLLFQSETVMLEMHNSRLAAEVSRLRGTDDPALWEVAAVSAEGFSYSQALARWRWASALLAAGSRDAATEQLLMAYETACQLGARPLRDALAALARRGRIALPGTPAEPPSDLTPRELAVLELVAAGLTNKQVGVRLYISQKTASVHLSRAMAKLGAANRTELVSIAHDRGLLS